MADAQRRLAAHRTSLHGNLANRILGRGVTIKAEKVSYKAFQRRYGRSVGQRAPGMFMEMLARKAASAGGRLIDVNTRTTALSHVFSGFLVRHVDDTVDIHRLDVESAEAEWWARRDGIRGWPASKRTNRRVPPVLLVGHLGGSEPVGHTGTNHRRARPPADPGRGGTAA